MYTFLDRRKKIPRRDRTLITHRDGGVGLYGGGGITAVKNESSRVRVYDRPSGPPPFDERYVIFSLSNALTSHGDITTVGDPAALKCISSSRTFEEPNAADIDIFPPVLKRRTSVRSSAVRIQYANKYVCVSPRERVENRRVYLTSRR